MQGNFTFYILIALVVGYLAYYFIWRQKEAKKLQEYLNQEVLPLLMLITHFLNLCR